MPYSDEEQQILCEFGRRVRVARDALGWTQEDLAEEAGLDDSYVGGVERGERNIGLLNVNKLAVALGEPFDGFWPYRTKRRRGS